MKEGRRPEGRPRIKNEQEQLQSQYGGVETEVCVEKQFSIKGENKRRGPFFSTKEGEKHI